ncbi:hypothetical protein SMACR_00587 [Sordaria macrospora]|uniref:Uncharacterized protein n=1 Tax=Sordaria macrospora TaxID=5147 RepID=A0A8S8ZEE6_SORMA|nr:hypothetical protein SMACR_00587 [Sordaria macrospora]WPJ59338.1 hypothetical protein SMAC4_00587 [Sordaria macrospora]
MTSSSPPDDKIDDEMILDCITVKPKPSHSYTDMTSSPPDDKPAAGSPVSTTRRKWAGPIPAYLFDSDTPPAPAEHEPVASSPKKRKLVAPMAGSLSPRRPTSLLKLRHPRPSRRTRRQTDPDLRKKGSPTKESSGARTVAARADAPPTRPGPISVPSIIRRGCLIPSKTRDWRHRDAESNFRSATGCAIGCPHSMS